MTGESYQLSVQKSGQVGVLCWDGNSVLWEAELTKSYFPENGGTAEDWETWWCGHMCCHPPAVGLLVTEWACPWRAGWSCPDLPFTRLQHLSWNRGAMPFTTHDT